MKRFWLFLPSIMLLAISCVNPDSTGYPLIVIDTFHPGAGGYNDTLLALVDATGATLVTDDNGNPDQADNLGFSRITYTKGLASGDYYIKINNPEGLGDGYYVIRVLTTDPDSIFPTVAAVNELTDRDDEVGADGLPLRPVTIKLGELISRRLYPVATDVDWFVVNLPEVMVP